MSLRTAVRRPAALVLQAAVLTSLAGGTAAWSLTTKTITVAVDGRPSQVRTHGSTVRDVLAAAHLHAGPHDLLAPAAEQSVADGDRVVLRRGRQLRLVVDGRSRSVWVTAASVQEALSQIGVRTEGAYLSASRSREIPLTGLSLQVRLPKTVTVLADGHARTLRTTRLTVLDALIQTGVRLQPADRLSAPRTALLHDGTVVRVTRISRRLMTESLPLPYATTRRADASLFSGDTKVVQAGRVGVLVRTYALSYVDGKLRSKVLTASRRTAQPVTQVVAVGTKPRPAVQRSSSTGTSADGLNWAALARCESGGNPRAVSSGGTYRGLYQFSFSTWRGVGGVGDPIDASGAEQTYRAKILYSRSGRSPWPVCGKYL